MEKFQRALSGMGVILLLLLTTMVFGDSPYFDMDKNGKASIKSTLWALDPQAGVVGSPLDLIRDKGWDLIGSLPDWCPMDPKDLTVQKQFPKEMKAVRRLIWKKTDDSMDHLEVQKLNQRFSFWLDGGNEGGRAYLVDHQEPVEGCELLETDCICAKAEMEKLGPNLYRLYIKDKIVNGRLGGTPLLHIVDVDLSSLQKRIFEASFIKDTTEKDKKEVVLQREVAEGLNWFWVIRWDGRRWVNVSGQEPDFYRNFVVKALNPTGASGKSGSPLFDALLEAAKKGGPSAFIKR